MGAWEPFHFGLLGLNYNYLQSLLKLQVLVYCDLFRNIFVPKGLSWLRFTLNGKKYSVLSYLVPPHRVSVFCYSTALPECWLIETENESIKFFPSISWRDGELCYRSDPRRKHSAQSNPWHGLLQQPLSHRENLGSQGLRNCATRSRFSFLVWCLTAFSCHGPTENCIFTVPGVQQGCCSQR